MTRVERRKNKRRKSIKPMHVILAIAIILVATSTYLFLTDTFGLSSSLRGILTASQVELFDEDGLLIFDGDYNIDEADTILENTHILGNLYLASGIGDGSVTLANVIVDGIVFIQGGGPGTISITDCRFPELRVNRPDGTVRLVAKGETIIGLSVLETSSILEENVDRNFDGFGKIEVMTAEDIKLTGSFESVRLTVKDALVEIESVELEELVVTRTAAGSTVKCPDGMVLNNLYVDGSLYMIGFLEVDEAFLSAPGITELSGNFNLVRITAEAGLYTLLEESTFAEVVIALDSLNNELILEPEVLIASLELNEAVEVKGEGQIELVIVKAPGSTMEQIPLDIVFGEEVSILIAGHEISSPEMLRALIDHGDPNYYAAVTEDTSTPVVQPAPAPPPEPDPAPAPAPEPTPEPEPTPAPAAVKEFKIGPGLTPGMKVVTVSLTVDDPQNYKVVVNSIELDPLFYEGVVIGFKKELDEKVAEDADKDRSKIVVIKLGS